MEINKSFNLSGKIALITGSSQGIGKAIALTFAEHGADIIINYRNNHTLAHLTAEEIKKYGVKVWLWPFDLAADNVLEKFQQFIFTNRCPPDILVANASLQIRKAWYKITNEEFDKQINVNLRATLNLIQGAVPYMKEKSWGRILTIGSVQQNRPHEDMCVYAASKFAVLNLIRNLAPQLAPSGITINNLAPGVIATGRNEEILADATYKKLTEKKIPLGYIGETADCAPAALLLCSNAGRYITGADYSIDGGMSLFK